jgi:hypothetical protein
LKTVPGLILRCLEVHNDDELNQVSLANRPLVHWGESVINFNQIGLVAMACLKYF